LNCFTPVAWAVDTRLNGGKRLVSTYGANAVAAPDGDPSDELGDGLAEPVGEGEAEPLGERGTERLGVGVGEGAEGDEEGAGGAVLAVADGGAAGPEPPGWHEVPLIVQPPGWPAVPADSVSKPTVTVAPGLMVASQPSLVTVTWPPSSVYEPSQREVSEVPFGSVKASVQPVTAAVPGLVIVY
jgi:hypothetical protein